MMENSAFQTHMEKGLSTLGDCYELAKNNGKLLVSRINRNWRPVQSRIRDWATDPENMNRIREGVHTRVVDLQEEVRKAVRRIHRGSPWANLYRESQESETRGMSSLKDANLTSREKEIVSIFYEFQEYLEQMRTRLDSLQRDVESAYSRGHLDEELRTLRREEEIDRELRSLIEEAGEYAAKEGR